MNYGLVRAATAAGGAASTAGQQITTQGCTGNALAAASGQGATQLAPPNTPAHMALQAAALVAALRRPPRVTQKQEEGKAEPDPKNSRQFFADDSANEDQPCRSASNSAKQP